MKNTYIKTSLSYLKTCIWFIILIAIVLYYSIIEHANYFDNIVPLGIPYAILAFCSISETLKYRKKQDEVLHKGRWCIGKGFQLQEVSYEHSMGRFGKPLYKTGYRLEVEVTDEFGYSKRYVSDVFAKKEAKGIPEQVRVYEYFGEYCITWSQKDVCRSYNKVVSTENICEKESRLFFIFLGQLFAIIDVGIIFAMVLIQFIGK